MNAKPVLTLTLNRSHRIATPHMSRGGTLLGIFLGLLIGLLCAFGVIWYLNKTPLPFLDKTARPEKSDKPVGEASQQAVQPQQLPGKPGDKVINGSNEKPRFEFYKILPGAQEATPGTVAGLTLIGRRVDMANQHQLRRFFIFKPVHSINPPRPTT